MARTGNGDWGRDAYEVANAAMEKADQVERDLAIRFNDIKDAQREAKRERETMHAENKEALRDLEIDLGAAIAAIGGRVDRLYNRAWSVAITIITAEAAIIIGVLGWAVHRVANP
jgi:hypothetical protein